MCKLHARASSPSSPVPPCPWGAHSPSSPTLGQPVLGLLGKCSLGGHEQDPSSSPSGVVTASPALGQDADPCHPTQPHQGHATSPPAQESDTAVTVAAGETAAATELPHVRPGLWLVALRVDQGGLDAGPAEGEGGLGAQHNKAGASVGSYRSGPAAGASSTLAELGGVG